MSEIEVVFYPGAAVGLLIFKVALWSLVTFIISIARICVSISLYCFLLIVDIEKLPLLLELPCAAAVTVNGFELCPWAAGLDWLAES